MDLEDDNSSIPMDNGEAESSKQPAKRGRKPGRKSVKSDMKVKLERSRQSARECRARKKLRYQYLEDLASTREKAVMALYQELQQYRDWAQEFDEGRMPEGMAKMVEEIDRTGNMALDTSTLQEGGQ